jgi:hypothetical protein
VETHAPDSQRPAGLLADLQVARAAILLVERDDNHTDILGETNPRNQAVEVARAVLSLTSLPRSEVSLQRFAFVTWYLPRIDACACAYSTVHERAKTHPLLDMRKPPSSNSQVDEPEARRCAFVTSTQYKATVHIDMSLCQSDRSWKH